MLSTPVLTVPSISSIIPNPNALGNDFGYPKNKSPVISVHYTAEHGHYNADKHYIPPVTTYRPAFSSTTTVSPPVSSSVSFISSTTTPQPPISPSLSTPSQFFLPPYNAADNSPIIRIKSYSPQPTPIAAYSIQQINNELQAPFSSASSPHNGHSSSFPPVSLSTPATFYSSTVSPISASTPFYSSTISPISSTSAVPLFNRHSNYRGGSGKRPYNQQNQLDFGNGIDDVKKVDRFNARAPNGIVGTPNGFGYYLPRHYHEETYREANANNRDGSFGYVDPFGIRRVVYYRASPDGGFKVRKNNRYVGFNAKPYDSKK